MDAHRPGRSFYILMRVLDEHFEQVILLACRGKCRAKMRLVLFDQPLGLIISHAGILSTS